MITSSAIMSLLLLQQNQRPMFMSFTVFVFILVSCFSSSAGFQEDSLPPSPPSPPVGKPGATNGPVSEERPTNVRYHVPDLPLQHYQFWLKGSPVTRAEFVKICNKLGDSLFSPNSGIFQDAASNIIFDEQSVYREYFAMAVIKQICPRIHQIEKNCWGYETNCENIYLMPECYGSSLGQARDEQDHKIQWFNQADFGYILKRRRELSRFCLPDKSISSSDVSSLDCIKDFKSCWGQNLRIIFDDIPTGPSLTTNNATYILKPGKIGGWNCDLQLKRIKEESGQSGKLQSWFKEIENYNLNSGLESDKTCDSIVNKQTFFVKLDSPTNIYHYLNSAMNFYITMHLINKFSSDNQIVIWDNQKETSKFSPIWSAFSRNQVLNLADYKGKRVCFKKFVFVMPPRTLGGLYYNTQLVPGCTKTGLFDAFNKHILHRLTIANPYDFPFGPRDEWVNVVIVARTNKFRRILNQDDLKRSLDNIAGVKAIILNYDELEFVDSIKRSHLADVIIGIHGAGLTNTLFQPDWGALFELYDCKDRAYSDLARLRGVKYYTIDDKDGKFIKKVPVEGNGLEQGSYDDKFSNYEIDTQEFARIAQTIADRVRLDRKRYIEKRNNSTIMSSRPTTPTPKQYESIPELSVTSPKVSVTTESALIDQTTTPPTTVAPPSESVTLPAGNSGPAIDDITTVPNIIASLERKSNDEL